MYKPIVKAFRKRLESMGVSERDRLIDEEIAIIKSMDDLTYTNLHTPLRFWRKEHEFVIMEYRPDFKVRAK